MNPLLKRLAALRLKVRILDGWQGVCAVIALILGVGVTVGAIDFVIHLPTLVRALILVGLMIGCGAIVYRFLVRPFGKPCNNLNLALRVEEAYPELNDCLASTVQFLTQSKEELARVGGSEAMRERTVAETIEKASKYDFGRILDRRAAALYGTAACAVLIVAGLAIWMQGEYSRIAFWRLAEPFGGHTWTQMVVERLKNNKIEIVDAYRHEKIATKQPYHIKVNLSGQLPERLKNAKVEIRGKIRTDSSEPIVRENGAAYFIKRFDMVNQKDEFEFRIVYNDGAFPPRTDQWHKVQVLPEPRLVALDNQPSPQITLYPPAYTELKTMLLPAGLKNVEAFAGTKVRLRAKADRPLTNAWIVYQPTNPALFAAAWFAAAANQSDPYKLLARATAENVVWTRIPVTLEDDASILSAEFTPWVDGKYSLIMTDEYELEGHEDGDVHVLADPLPKVNVLRPTTNAKILFRLSATDEQFAIKSMYVEHRKRNPDGTMDEPQRIPLYDAKAFGKLIPEALARLGYPAPASMRTFPRLPMRGADLRLPSRKLDFETTWSLKNQFKEGDQIVIQICADDFCDVFRLREPGRSQEIELRIIGARKLLQIAEVDLAKIQEGVQKARKLQQEALETVNQTRKKDKLEPKDVDTFIDSGEGKQRAVNDIIGNTPKDGLRKDLNDLRQMLKDNNLEGTQAYQDAGRIKGTLDNVAEVELQQLEPKIADVRNDLTQDNQNTPRTKKKLEEIAKLEKRVLDSLDDLTKKIDPTAKMNDQKNQLRDIIEREKKLQLELEELKTEKQNLEQQLPDKKAELEKAFQEKVGQKATEQRELSQQLSKLIEEMKAEKDHQEELGNKENVKKLEETIEKLQKPKLEPMPKQDDAKLPINSQMKKIADDLKNQSEAQKKTLDQQKDIVEQLENALANLEGRNEDNTRQEIKERQDAEKKLDQLNKQLQQLRDDFKKAELIEEKEERLKKKEELNVQADKLAEEIEKTRRQLAQLQEQRAANHLKEAVDKIDDAREKAQNGQNPDQDIKDAQAELNRAKEDLKKSGEHLARELLIKIADQLKGIKERQDAVVVRSEDFHPKVMRQKSWSDALLTTMEGNMDAQKDIGDETETVKTKLKDAKVFHSILERAKKSMDDAGTEMKNRRNLGQERCYIDLGKEPEDRMDAKEIMEENESQTTTVKYQKDAAKRLDRLLEALKEEIAKPRPRPQNAKNEKDPDMMDPPQMPPGGDGLPSKAELKALHAEQLDLLERTKDFDARHPERDKLNDGQRRELRELAEEQERLQLLFGEVIPQQVPMPMPMPKEGEKK